MKQKRVPRIIDFTSLSDLFMLISVFFLILYSVNSLRTGVVAIAEREKAKKEIEEIQVKANLLNAFFSTDVLLEKINDTFNNTFTLIWNESRSGAKRIAV